MAMGQVRCIICPLLDQFCFGFNVFGGSYRFIYANLRQFGVGYRTWSLQLILPIETGADGLNLMDPTTNQAVDYLDLLDQSNGLFMCLNQGPI